MRERINAAEPKDLRGLATAQRYLLWALLVMIALYVAAIVWRSPVIFLAYLIANVVFLVCVLSTMRAIGSSVVLMVGAAIGMLVPIVNLLILIAVNGQATRALQAAGLKVGFMGVSKQELSRAIESGAPPQAPT